ncbi:MAG TPA: hypothetical protein VGX23_06925 [Actinocrinis sp.]|nr:hypothetical protein [Actinocrinis sp.]
MSDSAAADGTAPARPEAVRLSVVAADDDGPEPRLAELEDLCDWLRAEYELSGRVDLVRTPTAPGGSGTIPGPREMGAIPAALEIALGSGGALTVLAASIKSWFEQPRRSTYRIRVPVSGGRVVEIDADRAKAGEVKSLLVQAMEMTQQAAPGPTRVPVPATAPASATAPAIEATTNGPAELTGPAE